MRILIASDKYKGSLTATQVAQTISQALRETLPEVDCDLCPIADGGEGTTEAMVTALGGEWLSAPVEDAQGRPLEVRYGLCRRQGILEMSAASGLALVTDLPLKPETASTYGTGLMMKHAAAHGAERILIGIGGSATNDGGLGMAAALGWRFLDESGQELPAVMEQMHRLHQIEKSVDFACPVLVACDVENPLLGERGATRVYGRQKGVQDAAWFEERLDRMAGVVASAIGSDPRDVPGAGAAGGLGWGLMAFCGARLTSGFDVVAEQIGLEKRVAEADLIITGEGRLDAQTLHGKGPVGIAQMARRLGKRVIAFAGSIEENAELRARFDLAYAIKPAEMPLTEAVARAQELLDQTVRVSAPEIRALGVG